MIIPPPLDHCVYLLTRRDHVVIYVGVTSNLFARLGEHAKKTWWPEVAMIQVESFDTRALADMREAHLIATLNPFYNVAGSASGTERHLDEMRLAVKALQAHRRRREIERVRVLAVAPKTPVPTFDSSGGVTLAEAAPILTKLSGMNALTLHGLRKAASRPGFPAPIGLRGRGKTAPKVYDLEELQDWNTLRVA